MDSSWLCIFLLLIVVLGPLVAMLIRNNHLQRDIDAAHATYLAALDWLKAQPHNADLKQQALAAGRVYANLTRQRKGVTVYDEMAVMNDINAATAGATSRASAPALTTPLSVETVATRLQTLDALRTKGVITDEEYTERRKALLSEL